MIDQAAIITATLKPPPRKLGFMHWSTRLLAKHLKVSDATVPRPGATTGFARGGLSL